MLQDPEKPFEEWEQEVRAQTIDEAKAKCQAIADGQTLTDLLTVTQATVTPYKGTYRFIYWFRSERSDNDDDSNTGS